MLAPIDHWTARNSRDFWVFGISFSWSPAQGSQVQFVPSGDDLINLMNLEQLVDTTYALLPALTTLEVNGCRLNCPVRDLILPLGACEHVGTIKAVNSGLTGELPNLDPMPPTIVETGIILAHRSSLASSLEFLDLSGGGSAAIWNHQFQLQTTGNNLSYIAAVPAASQTLVLAGNKQPLRLAKDALRSFAASNRMPGVKR